MDYKVVLEWEYAGRRFCALRNRAGFVALFIKESQNLKCIYDDTCEGGVMTRDIPALARRLEIMGND